MQFGFFVFSGCGAKKENLCFPHPGVEKRDRLWEGKVAPDIILSGIVLGVDTHGK